MAPYMKVISSKSYIEITQQSVHPHSTQHRTSYGGRKSFTTQNKESYENNQRISINRARKKIRRLLECNFTNEYAFLTLTFKPSDVGDLTDIRFCNEMFSKFKKRLNHYLKKNNLPAFKYLGVTEFQDTNRNGVIHYHLLCNLIEPSEESIQDIWRYGLSRKSIMISNPTDNEKITSYLNKGIADPRLNNYKRYLSSHNLLQPTIKEITNTEEFYSILSTCDPVLITSDTFHNAFSGEIKYENYYLNNEEELLKYVQNL